MELQIYEPAFFEEVRGLIEQSRKNATRLINAELTALYWNIGAKIKADVLSGDRAEYGEQVIDCLSKQLTEEYGRGWSKKQLWHCVRLVEIFADKQIVSTLWRQLSWSNIKILTETSHS
jgi:hypothetical protein